MPTIQPPHVVNAFPVPIKRRKFLGIGLSGFAGISLLGLFRLRAQPAAEKPKASPAAWRNWALGWKYCKALTLAETIGRTTTWPPGIFRS